MWKVEFVVRQGVIVFVSEHYGLLQSICSVYTLGVLYLCGTCDWLFLGQRGTALELTKN